MKPLKAVNQDKLGTVDLGALPKEPHFAVMAYKQTTHWDGGDQSKLVTVLHYEWFWDKDAMEARLIELHAMNVKAHAIRVAAVYEAKTVITVSEAEV